MKKRRTTPNCTKFGSCILPLSPVHVRAHLRQDFDLLMRLRALNLRRINTRAVDALVGVCSRLRRLFKRASCLSVARFSVQCGQGREIRLKRASAFAAA